MAHAGSLQNCRIGSEPSECDSPLEGDPKVQTL